MTRLIDEITSFLESEGVECSRQVRDGVDVICATTPEGRRPRVILPLEIAAASVEEAAASSGRAYECAVSVRSIEGAPVIVTEDRWHSQNAMTRSRILAHLEVFRQAFARNCEVRRIEKTEARDFLNVNHSYGYAACRYHYGLFLKRQTGHLADEAWPAPGSLIAVATFSNARRWIKGEREIRSYEWTRYASLPGLRINGGMGKMLKTFIDEVHPDDIMSYADLEWSEGDVYSQLGFALEGQKEPVMFSVDTRTWERSPVKPGMTGLVKPGMTGLVKPGMTGLVRPGMTGLVRPEMTDPAGEAVIPGSAGNLFFRNFGSNKYRLKLTDYQ